MYLFSVPVWGASPAVGTHMWLVCQLELLDSLTHCHVMPKGWGDCMSILEEGLKGTTACGDDILADRMKLKGVLYFLKIGECDLLKRYLPHSPLQVNWSVQFSNAMTSCLGAA